jgi:hypothetical protein
MTDTYKHKADRSYAYGTGYYGGYGGYNKWSSTTANDKKYDSYDWDSYDNWLGLDTKKKAYLKDDEFLCEDCNNISKVGEAEYLQDFDAIVCKSCFDIYENDMYTAQKHITNNQKQLN